MRPSQLLSKAFARTRAGFITAIVFSLFINMLAFVGPMYMLQVYDRVITSRNVTTLILLTVIAAFLLLVYAVLERTRSAVLVRLGVLFDEAAREDLFDASVDTTLRAPAAGSAQSLRDMDTMREFLTGSGLISFCDAPWVPIFVAGCFILHPLFGIIALSGAIIIFLLALGNEFSTREQLKNASESSVTANNWASATFRNAEVLRAMGMLKALRQRWVRQHDSVLGWQAKASDRAGVFLAGTKFVRAVLQICILGAGAYLVILQVGTPGEMIAASIIMGRALAPVEAVVGNWKGFSAARTARARIQGMLNTLPDGNERIQLPQPKGQLRLEGVIAAPPGQRVPTIRGIGFQVEPGEAVGIVGPSAAGKSTLARTLVGVWPLLSGAVRLDGSDLAHWDPTQLGGNIGYLPQDIELFTGTIAENISRFQDGDDADVIAAAEAAGVHVMIQALPEGYNTVIGDGGAGLSGGQRQRVGLARAFYGKPPLIVLDEPNSNLDSEGEVALLRGIQTMKAAGCTIIIITHKPNVLAAVDKVAVIVAGQLQDYGEREAVLAKLTGGNKALPGQAPARQVAQPGAAPRPNGGGQPAAPPQPPAPQPSASPAQAQPSQTGITPAGITVRMQPSSQ